METHGDRYMNSCDFVTIFFNDEIEIDLLRIQAKSFQFVSPKIVNNIILVFNENYDCADDILFKIIKEYPVELYQKIKVFNHIKVLSSSEKKDVGTLHQILKLKSCKMISFDYYVLLDAKNHFIRKADWNTFFTNDNLPKVFSGYPGTMEIYFNNSMRDMGYSEKTLSNINQNLARQVKLDRGLGNKHITTTPVVFKTEYVLSLIKYISENNMIDNLKSTYTEFYLYLSFLYKEKKINSKQYYNCPCMSVFGHKKEFHNQISSKKFLLNNEHFCMIGLHRSNVKNIMDKSDLDFLKILYEKKFGNFALVILNKYIYIDDKS